MSYDVLAHCDAGVAFVTPTHGAAFVTPTHDRPELHESLYETFKSQTVIPKRLYVLDTSKESSPFFSTLVDSDVVYVHAPGAFPRTEGTSRIGAARNYINSLVTEPIIFHIDDDDWIAPEYAEVMLDRLGDADLCKMDVWRIITETDPALVLEWDTRTFGGKHFALMGDEIKETDCDPSEMPEDVIKMFRDGYGFSLVYPRSTWEQHPFPEEGTEDFPFVREVRDSGGKIEFVSDAAHLVLHLVSKRSKSGVFPQKIVGTAGASDGSLQAAVARRMIGLMSAMSELPSGKPIRVKTGVTYSILASLSDKHSLKSMTTQASKWGIHVKDARDNVSPDEYGVQAPASGYRLVHITASSDKEGEMPWKAPPPLSAFDKTSVVRAWSSAPAGLGFAHPELLGLGANYDPNALCTEMLQDINGYWYQQMIGPCSQVVADAQSKAASMPGVPIAVWVWDTGSNQWTELTYYNQPMAVTAGGSGPITTVTPPCPWKQLPDGQDVGIKAGYTYSAIASVSKNYSKQDIVSAMGETFTLLDYAEQGQRQGIPVDSDTDHRTVVATVRALKNSDDLPWSSPWPTTIFNLVHIWVSAPASACNATPPSPLGTENNPFVPIFVLMGLGAAAAGGWWYWRRERRKRLLKLA
jgi:hypothetical protein